MKDFEEYGFQIIYLASGITLTWLKPIQYTLSSPPNEYPIWLKYWSLLSLTVLLEQSFFPDFSSNLGYFFLRSILFFYLSEQKFSNSGQDFSSLMLKKVCEQTDFKVLTEMLKNDSDVQTSAKIHPWAPNPTSLAGLAASRIGQLSDEKLSIEDQEFLAENTLELLCQMVESPEDAQSINAMLCLLFLSEHERLLNKLVTLSLFSRLQGLMKNSQRQVNQSALKLSANLYSKNRDMQKEFLNLGFHRYLNANLKENDPISVFETIENIFQLISVIFNQTAVGDIYMNHVEALLQAGLRESLLEAEKNHGRRRELKDRISILKEIIEKIA